jgi:carbonic anhydrase
VGRGGQEAGLEIDELFRRNRNWASQMLAQDRDFFARLERQQRPSYLWIGCSDSRVPANQIVGMLPGEIFVHRNVANVVSHGDLNALSVLQYAIDVLHVRHVIVCGHYGCGGVQAAYEGRPLGLIDNWLRHVQDVHRLHREELAELPDDAARLARLCELNVVEQARNTACTSTVQDAWRSGRELSIHAWIYGLGDGLLRDLKGTLEGADQVPASHRMRQL